MIDLAVTSKGTQASDLAPTTSNENAALTAINVDETPAQCNGPARFPVSAITVDDGIQQRALGVDQNLVAEYAEDIADWIDVAPVVIYWDGETRWLADGFHRVRAAVLAGLADVPATKYDGTRRDAILYAASANQQHGLRRTNADKHRAVETLLSDPEWSTWTDNRVAAMAGVSQPFVSKVRAHLITVINCESEQPAVQLETVSTCEPEAESPADQAQSAATSAATAEMSDARLKEIWAEVRETRYARPVVETTPHPEAEPKRIGRDGKAYPARKPKPKPNPAEKAKPADANLVADGSPMAAKAICFRMRHDLSLVRPDDPNAVKELTAILVEIESKIAPKAKPSDDHNKLRVAMRAAHAVTAALSGLVEVEKDLLESDARTLMANLGNALERLTARFPVATTEGNADA